MMQLACESLLMLVNEQSGKSVRWISLPVSAFGNMLIILYFPVIVVSTFAPFGMCIALLDYLNVDGKLCMFCDVAP